MSASVKLYPLLFEISSITEEEPKTRIWLFHDIKTFIEDEILPLALKHGFRFLTSEEKSKLDYPLQNYEGYSKEWLLLHQEAMDVELHILESIKISRAPGSMVGNILIYMPGNASNINAVINPRESTLEQLEQQQVIPKFLELMSEIVKTKEYLQSIEYKNWED